MEKMKSYFDRPRYDGHLVPLTPKMFEDPVKHMEEIINFPSRKDDILLCTFPKSGSNWIYEITNMLVNSKAEYAPGHKHSVGMLELMEIDRLTNARSPRIINTHVPFGHLPRQHVEKGYKIVHIIRNPKDIAVSTFTMKKSIGFLCDLYPTTWSQYIDTIMSSSLRIDSWFAYEKNFETAKATGRCVNVHTAYYEEIKRNPVKEIARLAKFLKYPHTDELVAEIADKTSFQKLSKAADQKKDASELLSSSTTGTNYLFRKGTVGDWKNWFTVAQNERFQKIFDEEMKGTELNITFEI